MPPGIARRLLQWVEQDPLYAVLCLDERGTIEWASPGTRSVLGYEPNELVGRPVSTTFAEEDVAQGLDRHEMEVARRVGYSENDRWHCRKDGTRVSIGGSLTRVRDEDGSPAGFVKVMRDRTDVAAHLQMLENRTRSLHEAEQQKARFFASLVHELANPMAPIRTALELFERVDDVGRKPLQDIIGRQLEVMRRVLEDLRALVQSEQPSTRLSFERFELPPLLREVVDACRPAARNDDIALELLLPDATIEMLGDASRIHQVVHNLVTNAIKYTEPGGHVWVKLTLEGSYAVVRVEDTGVGIEPQMLPRIFDLFTQESSSRHLSQGGWGVGLAVVKLMVDAHGGSVEVRSDGKHRGSVFTVRLPLNGPTVAPNPGSPVAAPAEDPDPPFA